MSFPCAFVASSPGECGPAGSISDAQAIGHVARVDNGECDTFRFHPKEMVQVGHLRSRARREPGDTRRVKRLAR